jgi:NTP pyrophosphatase (non-canonical NTP hydrolase)
MSDEKTTLETALDFITQQCGEDSHKYFPNTADSVPHLVLALCGEVGELANIIKKVERGSLQWNEEVALSVLMEGADIQIYLACIFDLLKGSLYHAYMAKREINNERFIDASGGDSSDGTASLLPQQQDPFGAGAFVPTRDTLLP